MENELLIFYLGFHRGEDSHYYLICGRKVVAVETEPLLFGEGVLSFCNAIANGQL